MAPANERALARYQPALQDMRLGAVPALAITPTTRTDARARIVYLHGGAYTLFSARSTLFASAPLAHDLGLELWSIDYPRAPHTQYDRTVPLVSEALAAACADSVAVLLVGDSAGGSLAAAVALAARDHGGPQLCAQVLLYPGLDRDMGAASITSMPNAPLLRHEDIVYMHDLVDRGGVPRDPYQVPAYASDLSGLPPAIVVTGECDPIRDWGERYAARLRDAGVQTTLTRYPGMYHGFLMRSDTTARGRLAMAEVGALLKAKFAHPLGSNESPDQRTAAPSQA